MKLDSFGSGDDWEYNGGGFVQISKPTICNAGSIFLRNSRDDYFNFEGKPLKQ